LGFVVGKEVAAEVVRSYVKHWLAFSGGHRALRMAHHEEGSMYYACKILGGTERLINLEVVQAFQPAGSEGLRRTVIVMTDGSKLDIEGGFQEHVDRLTQAQQVAQSQ
jgi:hypothetical protein